MKTIQIKQTGTSEVLQYIDVAQPDVGPNQVLIKIAAIGVNYADVLVRKGDIPTAPLPLTPGEEYSGTIVSLSREVTHLKLGQRVAVLLGYGPNSGHVSGGYADYAVAESGSVIPIPDSIDFETAAATFANYLTADFLLHFSVSIQPQQTLLVYAAAGGGGTAMMQLARLIGARVIGLTSSDKRASYALSQGATHVINYHSKDVYSSVMALTGGRGVDVIFNSAGGPTLLRDFNLLAPFGQIVWYGTAAGMPVADISSRLAKGFTHHKGIKTFLIHSMLQYKPQIWSQTASKMMDYLVQGKIQPQIHQSMPLSEAATAHQLLETSNVFGKLILQPDSG